VQFQSSHPSNAGETTNTDSATFPILHPKQKQKLKKNSKHPKYMITAGLIIKISTQIVIKSNQTIK